MCNCFKCTYFLNLSEYYGPAHFGAPYPLFLFGTWSGALHQWLSRAKYCNLSNSDSLPLFLQDCGWSSWRNVISLCLLGLQSTTWTFLSAKSESNQKLIRAQGFLPLLKCGQQLITLEYKLQIWRQDPAYLSELTMNWGFFLHPPWAAQASDRTS